jgi:hypothetical protein
MVASPGRFSVTWIRRLDALPCFHVRRFRADPDAVDNMKDFYNTDGHLEVPLITMHTLRDQQIPYFHEVLYNLKTLGTGSFLFDHLNIPIDRYGHCEFTPEERRWRSLP